MEFEGTKGKWKKFDIINHHQHHTYFKISSSETDDPANSESICNIVTRNSERAEANAKLIASAPEMIDFINRIQGEMCRNDFCLSEKWADQAEVIIQKALGK